MKASVRELQAQEADELGELMVRAYTALPGFPGPSEQPGDYHVLGGIASFASRPEAKVLVALSTVQELPGGIVYFGDMAQYGSGGTATQDRNALGIHLLGVDPQIRGRGAAKALAKACIDLARESGHAQVILHTTKAMQVAWGMYERLGFACSEDLNFSQHDLSVYGFRLKLGSKP